jgi:hypothetical protein
MRIMYRRNPSLSVVRGKQGVAHFYFELLHLRLPVMAVQCQCSDWHSLAVLQEDIELVLRIAHKHQLGGATVCWSTAPSCCRH